jgi:hypothetical protein
VKEPDPSLPGRHVLPVTVRWAEISKGQSAILLCMGGWPDNVPVIGADGKTLWKYQTAAAVDSAAWVDLRGAGTKELLVGFNGNGGLHAVANDGRVLWTNQNSANMWTVRGISTRPNRPGLALSTAADGQIHLFNAAGKELRTLPGEGHYVTDFSAAEMNERGLRQVLAFWEAIVGRLHYAVAMDLEGRVLWKYPLGQCVTRWYADLSLLAADVEGSGTKQWIIRPRRDELAILDADGQLIARIENPGQPWCCWTAVDCENKPGWIVTADAKKITAYVLGPLEQPTGASAR